MAKIKTTDGTEIYYKDLGSGQPIVFSHGWPLSADAWEDQIGPINASAMLSFKLIRGAKLKVYPGAPHGLCSALEDRVNEDLLAFLEGRVKRS